MGKNLAGREIGDGLSQRKNGKYVYRSRKNSQEKSKSFDTLKEAKAYKLEFEKNAIEGIISNDFTVEKYFEDWILEKKDSIADTTFSSYVFRFETYIKPTFGKRLLTSITYKEVKEFFQDLSNKYSNESVHTIFNVFSQMYSEAVKMMYVPKSPLAGIKLKSKRSSNKEYRYLDNDEEEVLLKYAFGRIHFNIIAFALNTGLRASEICGLRVEDVDLNYKNGPALFVKRQLQYVNLNNTKREFHITDTKTKASMRTVPLNETAVRIYQNQLKQRKVYINKNGKNGFEKYGNLLFLTTNATPTLMTDVSKKLSEYIREINVQRDDTEKINDITFHSLRHTFASRLFETNDIETVKDLLGHTNTNFTNELYTHITNNRERDVNFEAVKDLYNPKIFDFDTFEDTTSKDFENMSYEEVEELGLFDENDEYDYEEEYKRYNKQ